VVERARMNSKTLMFAFFLIICSNSHAQPLNNSARRESGEILHQKASGLFEIYCDFQCPFCARLFKKLGAGEVSEGRTVNFKFMHYPFHENSHALALFYEAVKVNYPDKEKTVVDSLYKFQTQISASNSDVAIRALNLLHGMDPVLIARDMRARDTKFALFDSKQSAVLKKVIATPTVFYEGARVNIDEPEMIARYILNNSSASIDSGAPATTVEGDCATCKMPRGEK